MNSQSLELTNWKIYRNEKYRFEIHYPSNWTRQEQEPFGTLALIFVAFLSPQESASDMFLENINITVQDLSNQPMTLDEYTNLSINQMSQYITDFNIIDSSVTTLVGNPAHKIVYTGKEGQNNLKWMQIWTIKDNKAYVITYTAKIDTYSNFLGTIQQMINSFKLF